MKTFTLIFLIAAALFAQQAAAPQSESDLQTEYWQAVAHATAAQAAFLESLSDRQKQIEAQRDQFGAAAEAALKKMTAICTAKKLVLDQEKVVCATPKKEDPKK